MSKKKTESSEPADKKPEVKPKSDKKRKAVKEAVPLTNPQIDKKSKLNSGVSNSNTQYSKQRPLPEAPSADYLILNTQKLATDIVITCEHNYLKELDKNINTSGLRYKPCHVPREELNDSNEGTIQALYNRRINCLTTSELEVVIKVKPTPLENNQNRKICLAISVGCPATLTTEEYLQQLHWFRHAQDRPTYLLIHKSEWKTYKKYVVPLLKKGKVGLAFWSCGTAVGFGLTRRAAQVLSYKSRPSYELVMCDSNVALNDELSAGYETDEKERKRRLDPLDAHLCSPGLGEAKPTAKWGKKLGDLASTTGAGRPIEQVTVASAKKYLFDPAFITSNEDMALTALRYPNEKDWQLNKKKAKIRKFPHKDPGAKSNGDKTDVYATMRTTYLQDTLAAEDDVMVIYQWPKDEDDPERTEKNKFNLYRLTLGQLTAYLHTIHPSRDPWIVRSTIIEVILMAWLKKGKKNNINPLTASNANWPINATSSSAELTDDEDEDDEDMDTSPTVVSTKQSAWSDDDEEDEFDQYGGNEDSSPSGSEEDDEEYMTRQQREKRDSGYGYRENNDDEEDIY